MAMPKYFSSEWSFAQFRLTHDEGARSIVGFGSQPNTLLIITMMGSMYKVCVCVPQPTILLTVMGLHVQYVHNISPRLASELYSGASA